MIIQDQILVGMPHPMKNSIQYVTTCTPFISLTCDNAINGVSWPSYIYRTFYNNNNNNNNNNNISYHIIVINGL